MTRDSRSTPNRIALLATGDEITNGDILNTNAQIIAQKLFSNGIPVGLHMTTPDNISEIEQAINFLLQSHRVLIMTGGLGPTSDDITRYALSKAVEQPLIFDDKTWDAICERFETLGYKGEPPDGNRQQAMFPKGAKIISNPTGTAAGCIVQYQEKIIFMLPGPPFECLPMVDTVVLPMLKESGFHEILFYDHWLIFGIGESMIAEQLELIAKPFDCTVGYRLAYPYIEIKLLSNNEKDFRALCPLFEKALAPYLISDGKQTASTMLVKKIETLNSPLRIRDYATGGLLQNTLSTQKTMRHLDFFADHPDVEIHGLAEFWQEIDAADTQIEIHFKDGKKITKKIPFRGRSSRARAFAMELICQQISLFLE